MREIKIVILGSGGVGKSSMTLQYVQGIFIDKYDPTIEDSYKKIVDYKDQEIKETISLEILDTAGTEQFMAMRDMYIKSGDAFLLVYSISNYTTFLDAQKIYDHIARLKGKNRVPIILVGNKSDLTSERMVKSDEAKSLAKKWNVPWIEISAKRKDMIENLFGNLLIREIMKMSENNPSLHSPFPPSPLLNQEKNENKKCTIN